MQFCQHSEDSLRLYSDFCPITVLPAQRRMGCLPPPAGWLHFLSCACLSSLRTESLPRTGLSDTQCAKNTKGHLWEISCDHPDQRLTPRGDGEIPRMCSCARFLKMTLIYLFIFTIIPSYLIVIADLFCAVLVQDVIICKMNITTDILCVAAVITQTLLFDKMPICKQKPHYSLPGETWLFVSFHPWWETIFTRTSWPLKTLVNNWFGSECRLDGNSALVPARLGVIYFVIDQGSVCSCSKWLRLKLHGNEQAWWSTLLGFCRWDNIIVVKFRFVFCKHFSLLQARSTISKRHQNIVIL